MEKKTTRIYIIIFILSILTAVFLAPFFKEKVYNRTNSQAAVHWNDKMEMLYDGNSYIYRTTLPTKEIDGRVIGYDSVHMQIEVTIAGEVVYSIAAKEGYFTKTTGCCWNFITLTQQDAGKEIIFRVTPIYKESKPTGSFYFGTQSAVEHLIMRQHLLLFVIAVFIFLIGVSLFFYVVFVIKKTTEGAALFHFSLFASILGIWYCCESQILELFLTCYIGVALTDHLMLMLLPIPFLLFLKNTYQSKEHILWNIICYLNCAVVILRIMLQLTGLSDFRETLWITHTAIGLSILAVFILSVSEIIKYQLTRQVKMCIFCILVIMVTVLLELLEYRIYYESMPFASLGFLFYIVVMGADSIHRSHKMIDQARESELYRKLAFTDELTKLYNRTAFNRDLNDRCVTMTEQKIMPTVLFMFDLNDLKKCNDGFGHEYGDRYIKMVSAVIEKVFGRDGKCYRIGGDEFCVIMNATTQEDTENRYNLFMEEIKKKNAKPFVVPVSVAVGYAVYDAALDESLEATMKRADDMMYRNKQELKKQRNADTEIQ